MQRRDFLRRLAAGTAALAGASGAARGARAESRPSNVVLFVSDDWGWPFYGFMRDPRALPPCELDGLPVPRTPTLDRLVREGVGFHRGVVTAARCQASRESIFTGLNRRDLRVRRFETLSYPGHPTIPVELARRGYRTLGIGKWEVARGGLAASFTDNEKYTTELGRGPDDVTALNRGELQIVDRFLEERRDDGVPWMLYVGPRLPHQPFQRPREAPYQYDDVDLDAARACKQRFTISPVSFRRFLGSCTWVDELLRRIVEDKLGAYGFDSNTLVVYTTDNGAVLRRGKGSFREAGMRTPIVAWAKDLLPPTGLHPGLVGTIDIFPTILDALGIDPSTGPTFPDGKSFLPLLADPSARASEEFRRVFYSNWRPDGKRAVRDDRYKLYTSLFGREEAMFDLEVDPFERVNLMLRDRLTPETDAIRASLARDLEAWWCGRGDGGLACS